MNDQRQVIFSQRLSILKSKQVTQIIKNFLTDSISNLVLAKEEFSKTGDQKLYLTSIKSLIGNVVDDSELIKKSSLDKNKFKELFINIFNKKKDKRITLIGDDQNNDLEKRFLQIIDFSGDHIYNTLNNYVKL